jgi:chemotaxis protein MotB
MKKILVILVSTVFIMTGCVSKKKYDEQVNAFNKLKGEYDLLLAELNRCNEEKDGLFRKVRNLEEEVGQLKANTGSLLNQLSDLSVISKAQAESVKKSIDILTAKDFYIQNLQNEVARKDSLNMVLMRNLKRELVDEKDDDVQIKVEGSAVFISLSDKMLFNSGSYALTPRAKQVLGKVAKVINAHKDFEFMVEGHADNRKINRDYLKDNWDLSVLRATSVVRVLQQDFKVDPSRMIAAGRGEFIPLADNNSAENMQLNRRTRIVVLPQLDQFFKLFEGN